MGNLIFWELVTWRKFGYFGKERINCFDIDRSAVRGSFTENQGRQMLHQHSVNNQDIETYELEVELQGCVFN